MMSRKAVQISVDFDIHAVSCPGVWLCQNGDVMLRIEMLGILKHTKRVDPIFPLLFHEQFSFRKAFPSIGTLKDLHVELNKRSIHLDLIQWCVGGLKTVILASFKGSLSDVLYPSPLDKGLVAGVDVDLLMETTKYFPGIISPKIEISSRVVIEEMTNYAASGYSRLLNPMTVSSKKLSRKTSESHILPKTDEHDYKNIYVQKKVQKPVCHAKQKNRCYCSKNSLIKHEEKIKKMEIKDVDKTIHNECDKIKKCCTNRPCRAIKSKDEEHCKKENIMYRSKECCDVCRKYEDYFNCFYNTSVNQSLVDCPCICWRGTFSGQKSCKKKALYTTADTSNRYEGSIDTNRLFSCGDLELHYKKLYERICKNNNSEQTQM